MDDEVVIELGSSDEEAEPPPKKRKPMPNAMVHIPTILPGITIKPAICSKSIPSSLQCIPIKQNAVKPVKQNAIQKSNMLLNPFVNKLKSNSVSVSRTGKTVIFRKEVGKPLQNKDRHNINTISLNKSSIVNQTKKGAKQNVSKKSLPIKGPQVLNFLPSGITVTKASKTKPKNVPSVSGLPNQKLSTIIKPISKEKELLTVNLDDEESTPSPQWYLRPEEESNKYNESLDASNDGKTEDLEEQNNKEPEVKKYVEITIEDSPMKPVEDKQTTDIGRELPIIIDDSPCKIKPNIEERCEDKDKPIPQSKKKLDYPNNNESTGQIVEIEIDLIETSSSLMDSENRNIKTEQESKDSENETLARNKLEVSKQTNETNTKSDCKMEEEFHSVYQEFIDTCFKLENSEDMKKIVEKKIKTYYKQCPKEYVESEEFIDIVSSKIMAMKAGPDKLYLYIKDVVDELNLQRKMAKANETKKEIVPKVSERKFYATDEETEFGTKRSRQIRKLEKTIKKLHRAIQKLEEQEVDFDDEDDSVFLLTERYKERLVRVHAKFCQMTNTKMPSEPRILLETRPGRPLGPTKKLEKFINKKVPIGTPLPFPDFHDVLRCVQEANKEDNLGWNDMDIKEEARDLFVRCGKKLQRRRQENEWRIAVSRVQSEVDPAEKNDSLKQKLTENKAIAANRENEIFKKFVDKQNQLKLEAEEIGDKEAEESPVESDDEEVSEISSSLEDKQKRKDRLKRLIQEKNKKATEKKVTPFEKVTPVEKVIPVEKFIPTEKDIPVEKVTTVEQVTPVEEKDQNVQTVPTNNDDNDKNIEENNKASEEPESKSDNTVNIDADELNNNDDKESESNVDSDIDELHLLQKLHFEDEINSSSSYSSDSDSPIAISDTLESDSEYENKRMPSEECDVISIENSSYSESEPLAEEDIETLPTIEETDNDGTEALVSSNSINEEVEFSTEVNKDPGKAKSKDEIENIILAWSEDDATSEKDTALEQRETCINLNDNASLDNGGTSGKDTVLEDGETCINLNDNASSEDDGTAEKDTVLEDGETCINLNDNASSEEDGTSEKDTVLEDGETCINLRDDALSITEMLIEEDDMEKDAEGKKLEEESKDVCKDLDEEVHMDTSNANIESPSDVLIEPKDDMNESDICLSNNINSESDFIHVKDND